MKKSDELNELKQQVSLVRLASAKMKLEKRGGEFWGCCPFHGENTPSFAIKVEEGAEKFYCLAGETGVLTWDGIKSIKELAGKTATVLTKSGEWVDAPFFSFGQQPLYNIVLTRNGQKKIVRATAEHRWFIRAGAKRARVKEILTQDLKPMHRLESVFPRCAIGATRPSPIGIAHGFVFGDGTLHGNYGSVAQFCGEKDSALVPYFSMCHIAPYGDVHRAFDLPKFFKSLPPADECPTYLYGWLAGYFAADGCVADDGTATLYSSVFSNLEFVRMIATRMGIATYGVIRHERSSGYNNEPLFSVTFINSSLRENFFLIPEHKARFVGHKKEYERMRWTVQAVEYSGCTEEVFCAVVEKDHTFVLEDNIITGNCQGCGKGGSVIDFVVLMDKCTLKDAINKLKAMVGNDEYKAGGEQVMATFQPVGETKEKKVIPMLAWPPKEMALLENAAAMDWLQNKRGLNIETIKGLRLGFVQSCGNSHLNPEDEHARTGGWVMFPRINGDKIVAVKMRGVTAKAFTQVTGMDAKALYNVNDINAMEPVFLTEGELDTGIFKQAGFCAVSIPNANYKITPEGKLQLKNAACVFLAGDNDGSVGNEAMKQLQRELGENTYIIVWPGAKDANEYFLKVCGSSIAKFRDEITRLAAEAKATPIAGFKSLLERLRSTVGTDAGKDPHRLHFPIESIDRMNYSPAGSIVVIYSTYSGTGKTVFTTQVMLHEAKRGEVVVVYSPELRDENYLALVAAQVLGPKREGGLDRAGMITAEDYNETAQVLDKLTERGTPFTYYVGHSLPVSDNDEVLEFIEQTIKVTGATRFVIDTIHRVIQADGRKSQTEEEGAMIKHLEALGIKYGTIFVLIGQSNKEAEEIKEQRRDSHGVLRGSRELQDVPFATYLLHRKRKPIVEGQETKDLLEMDTDIVLKKDRGRGPGNAIVRLVYKPESSLFFAQTKMDNGPQGSMADAPPPSYEESKF